MNAVELKWDKNQNKCFHILINAYTFKVDNWLKFSWQRKHFFLFHGYASMTSHLFTSTSTFGAKRILNLWSNVPRETAGFEELNRNRRQNALRMYLISLSCVECMDRLYYYYSLNRSLATNRYDRKEDIKSVRVTLTPNIAGNSRHNMITDRNV